MPRPVPRFALRYIPKELLEAKPSEEKWTLVEPKKRRTTPKILDGWTESATFVKGKREGWATWKNTKTDVEVLVDFKNNVVQSLRYYNIEFETCDRCWDALYTVVEYSNGVFSRRKTNRCAGCYESIRGEIYRGYGSVCGYGCTCGTCLCSAAEAQWERSHSSWCW